MIKLFFLTFCFGFNPFDSNKTYFYRDYLYIGNEAGFDFEIKEHATIKDHLLTLKYLKENGLQWKAKYMNEYKWRILANHAYLVTPRFVVRFNTFDLELIAWDLKLAYYNFKDALL